MGAASHSSTMAEVDLRSMCSCIPHTCTQWLGVSMLLQLRARFSFQARNKSNEFISPSRFGGSIGDRLRPTDCKPHSFSICNCALAVALRGSFCRARANLLWSQHLGREFEASRPHRCFAEVRGSCVQVATDGLLQDSAQAKVYRAVLPRQPQHDLSESWQQVGGSQDYPGSQSRNTLFHDKRSSCRFQASHWYVFSF